MAKPSIQDAIDILNNYAGDVMLIGIDKVAEHAGLKPRVVRKFTINVLEGKNADIRKILLSVKALKESNEA